MKRWRSVRLLLLFVLLFGSIAVLRRHMLLPGSHLNDLVVTLGIVCATIIAISAHIF